MEVKKYLNFIVIIYMFIIFTIGRTGSSMLINILNNFENVTFSGEIYNIQLLRKLNNLNNKMNLIDFRVFESKELKRKGLSSKNPLYFPRNTNYHKYFHSPNKFLKEFGEQKTIFDRIKYVMPQDKIVGCKLLAKSSTVEDFLKYKNVMKHFKIILLVRNNIDALRNSMKRAGFCSYKYVKLDEENMNYKRINEENDNTYLLSYEDILNKNENFKNLFKFIGVPYNQTHVDKRFGEVCSYASRRDLFK